MTDADRLRTIITSLMVADHLGDVHRNIDALREMAGLPPLEGNFLDGWTDRDKDGLGWVD